MAFLFPTHRDNLRFVRVIHTIEKIIGDWTSIITKFTLFSNKRLCCETRFCLLKIIEFSTEGE